MEPANNRDESALNSGLFPETNSGLLAAAADGRWEEFLAAYLRPCWKNLLAACRARGLDLNDADDLFQELIVRLMRPGRFGPETLRKIQEEGLSQYRGNLPARYLRLQDLPLQSAKFRTYLKAVTTNLLAEALRERKRRTREAVPVDEIDVQQWLDESVGHSYDRSRTWEVLRTAIEQFYRETATARTRGQRRHFSYLYYTFVGNRSPGIIALRYGLNRATVSEGLDEARRRFVEIVRSLCGDDAENAVRLLIAEPHEAAEVCQPYSAAVEAIPD